VPEPLPKDVSESSATRIVSIVLSVIGRGIVAVILWGGIGIVVLLAGALGGYSSGKTAIGLWYASSIALLVWIVLPFFPKGRDPAATEGSTGDNANQSNQAKNG
jgi:hypothetical protein